MEKAGEEKYDVVVSRIVPPNLDKRRVVQGGRSCTGAQVAPAEKFGLYAILSRIKICADLRTFWRSLGKKVPFWVKNGVSWARSALLNGIYCIIHTLN